MKLAAIESGGKQYLVSEGDKIKIEKLPGEVGDKISFDTVLLASDGKKIDIGTPYVSGAKVDVEIVKTARTRKVIVFHYHNKTRYRKKNTHRQWYTEVLVNKISA